jgi:hypothetical protein
MASGETLHVLKEVLVYLTLEQCSLWTWVFIAEITSEFFLRLDVLVTHDISMDLRRHQI